MSEVKGTNSPVGNNSVNAANTSSQAPTMSIAEKTQIKFHSADLHQTKVATRENPFAEQNRQAAEKKAKQQRITKKSLIITGIALGTILVVGFLIWLIWWLFTFHIYEVDRGLEEWQQEADKVYQEAQEIYDTGGTEGAGSEGTNNEPGSAANIEAVDKFFDDKVDQVEDISSKIDIVLMEIVFYDQNSRPDLVIRASEEISEYADQMSLTQLALYAPVIYNNYITLGNDEKAEYWMNYAIEKGAIDGEDGAG